MLLRRDNYNAVVRTIKNGYYDENRSLMTPNTPANIKQLASSIARCIVSRRRLETSPPPGLHCKDGHPMAVAHDGFKPLKLSEFCDRVLVDEREVRYALARGIVPKGVRKTPGSGHHRRFNAHQSFWLAIVLRLKAAGIKTPLAGEIAKWSERLKVIAVNSGWDWEFSPFDGRLQTEHSWILEVGDAKFVRILTNAYPSAEGLTDVTNWVCMTTKKVEESANPIVVVAVNLSELASLLLGERSV